MGWGSGLGLNIQSMHRGSSLRGLIKLNGTKNVQGWQAGERGRGRQRQAGVRSGNLLLWLKLLISTGSNLDRKCG